MPVTGGPTEVDRVRALREVLTATGAGIYLATHVAGPVPAETLTAVHESDELELRIGRVGRDRPDDLEQREKEARAVAAAAIKASPERVVLAHGVPEATRAIALELLARSEKAVPRVIAIAGLEQAVVDAVRSVAEAVGADFDLLAQAPQILAADVELVVMSHVQPDGGLNDVTRVAETVHKADAQLLLDAGMSVGALPLEVGSLGADGLIAATHRWLLGPDAMALAWLAPGLGEDLPGRLRQSTGPFGRGALLALARSVGWLLMYIDLPWAVTRTRYLAKELYGAIAGIDGIEISADPAAHGALIGIRIEGWDAEQAADELSRSVFAIVDVDPDADVIRASVGAWNREDELDRFVERLAELAEHTPETLPRKPSLTVLSGPLDPEEEA